MYNAMSSIMVITREILNEFKPMNLKFLSSFQPLFNFQWLIESLKEMYI